MERRQRVLNYSPGKEQGRERASVHLQPFFALSLSLSPSIEMIFSLKGSGPYSDYPSYTRTFSRSNAFKSPSSTEGGSFTPELETAFAKTSSPRRRGEVKRDFDQEVHAATAPACSVKFRARREIKARALWNYLVHATAAVLNKAVEVGQYYRKVCMGSHVSSAGVCANSGLHHNGTYSCRSTTW